MSILKSLPLYKKSDLRYLCERLIPLTQFLNVPYGSSNVFCPFHPNTNTPAASLFKDADGIERLYCYVCRRQYTSYDYITIILEENPLDYLLKVATKEELDEMLTHKIDKFTLETSKLVFKDIDTLLSDVYDIEEALGL